MERGPLGLAWIVLLVLLALLPGTAMSQPQPQSKAAPIVLKQHTMLDPKSGNMESHTVLAPSGWKVEGGAWWAAPAMFQVLPSQDIKITAPDGRMVHVGPAIGATDYRPSAHAMQQLGVPRPAEGTVDRGYPIIYMPDDLEAWRAFIEAKAFRSSFPNATALRVEPVVVVPELTKLLHGQLQPLLQLQNQNNQQAQAMGINMRGFMDGAVLAATCFYELDGKKWEHLIVFGTTMLGTDSDIGRQLIWTIEPCVSYRAPAGELEANMPLLMSIANSTRPTPQWAKMKSDHIAKMQQISAKGAADRSAILSNANREIGKMITDGWNERQASMDRSHYNVIKSIREVEDYTVAGSNSAVQLPSHYEHVYTNGQGDYLLTNDSLYNPNVDPALNKNRWDTMNKLP